ncbi:hypothetical protein CR513_01848, partial [Mucuna pruriens]
MNLMNESKIVKEYFDKLLRIANQAQEQRRLMRFEWSIEGVLVAKASSSYGGKGKQFESYKDNYDFSPCKHCGRKIIHLQSVGGSQTINVKNA